MILFIEIKFIKYYFRIDINFRDMIFFSKKHIPFNRGLKNIKKFLIWKIFLFFNIKKSYKIKNYSFNLGNIF